MCCSPAGAHPTCQCSHVHALLGLLAATCLRSCMVGTVRLLLGLVGVGPAGLPCPKTPSSHLCWADSILAVLQPYFGVLKVPAGAARFSCAALCLPAG